MAKKLSIPVNLSEDYTVIAISCHLKEYRISFQVNQSLRIKLKREGDLIMGGNEKNGQKDYALYSFNNLDQRCYYLLLANHHPDGKLLNTLRQVDYFLIVTQLLSKEDINRIVFNLRNINGVLMAYLVESRKVPDMDLLLNDLEMHLMTA
jgi:hypothetical protein